LIVIANEVKQSRFEITASAHLLAMTFHGRGDRFVMSFLVMTVDHRFPKP
jgi:hypothetical protein